MTNPKDIESSIGPVYRRAAGRHINYGLLSAARTALLATHKLCGSGVRLGTGVIALPTDLPSAFSAGPE